jgi:hypothetical protein
MTSPRKGWYPSPDEPGMERWWTGNVWFGASRPGSGSAPPQPPPGPGGWQPAAASPGSEGIDRLVLAGSLILAVIGLIVEIQPVSLLTGSGTLWVGAALAAGGCVLAFAMRAATWARAITVVVLAICIFNLVTTEHELDQRRQQIQQIFGS